MAKKVKTSVTINGSHGMSVKHTETITGKVRPKDGLVQVLVYSADKKWYLQKDAVVDKAGKWSVDVTFGNPDPNSCHEYIILAMVGDKIKEPTHDFPPAGEASNELHVTRTE